MSTAQLPGPNESDDRIFVGSDVVIMLDGASAFLPTEVTAADYVDHLGPALMARASSPDVSLADALADAIEHTASVLALSRGRAPSSTVAIVRTRGEVIDLLVLGDSQIATHDRILNDSRLAAVGTPLREAYRQRLRQGHGYNNRHRDLLTALQQEQRSQRNQEGGYWIAEADGAAAAHALVEQHALATAPWLVLATDGAYRPMSHLLLDDWAAVADSDQDGLVRLLTQCQQWESEVDPSGTKLPRAKQHDDKSLAVVRPGDM